MNPPPKMKFDHWKSNNEANLKELYEDFLTETRSKREEHSFEQFCRGLYAETRHAQPDDGGMPGSTPSRN